MRAIAASLLFALAPLWATVPSTAVWETRTTGSDTNGGGFVTGAAGTDYSQNDNKNGAACSNCGSSTINLSTTDAVGVGTITVTSATGNFTSAIVGNVIYLAGGTGSLTGAWYQVTTFTDVHTVLVDRDVISTTGATMNIGGALLSLPQLFTNLTAGQGAYIKSGTYTLTSSITLTVQAINLPTTFTYVNGYGSTRGDGGTRPLITTATDSTPLFDFNQVWGFIFNHISFSTTASIRTDGINFNASNYFVYSESVTVQDCVFDGFTKAINGDDAGANDSCDNLLVIGCEFKNSTTPGPTDGVVQNEFTTSIIGSYFHDNAGPAVVRGRGNQQNGPLTVRNTVFYKNTNGVKNISGNYTPSGAVLTEIDNCAFVENTSDGVVGTTTHAAQWIVTNNVFDTNGGYGWNASPSGVTSAMANQNNFYYGNALGALNNILPGTGDVTGTARPFVAPASANFALDTTTGGGAACTSAGYPGVMPAGTGYQGIGPLQSQAGGGAPTAHGCASAR